MCDTSNQLFAQGATCAEATQLCDLTGCGTFEMVTDQGNDLIADENSSCLGGTLNAAWFFLIDDQGGGSTISIGNTSGFDTDFAAWGPFDTVADALDACNGGISTANEIGCDFSTAPGGVVSIPTSSVVGDIYLLVISNFFNEPGIIVDITAPSFCDVLESDSLALVALYNSTDGPNWTNTWDLSQPVSEWYGITLDDGGCRVIEINLNGNQLSGNIPSELGNLSNLTELYLGRNELIGSIPSELGDLSNLKILALGGSGLYGYQLNATFVFTSGSFNQLSGSIPSSLSDLSNLEILDLVGNELSGNIPSELGDLSNLTGLYLGGNQLSGSIPPELGNLSKLKELDISFNQISDIPNKLGDLSSLEILNLRINQISNFPSELGNLSNLVILRLENNQLSGSIPSELGNLSNLGSLWLYANRLSGIIPPELGNLSNVEFLYLGGNQLSGSIPSELGNLSNLVILWLYGNQLSGNIPSVLGNLSNLETLHLWGNKLSGSIPSELGDLPNLTSLSLSVNNLSGCYPESLCTIIDSQVEFSFENNPNLPDGGSDAGFLAFCNQEAPFYPCAYCTDLTACNYDPNATEEDDSLCQNVGDVCRDDITWDDNCECIEVVSGCTDPNACNYNPNANEDDGACDYGVEDCPEPCNAVSGCMDPEANNFNPSANCNISLLCDYLEAGCPDPAACNYDPDAKVDDGSCDYGILTCPEPCNVIIGCTDPTACNYDDNANCDGGFCVFETCIGSIEGVIFYDNNENGFYDDTGVTDAPESPISGVTITLTYPNEFTETTISDENGFYRFDNLPIGDFTVTVGDGPEASSLTTDGIVEVILAESENNIVNFGFTAPLFNSVFITVFDDPNGNGIQDINEAVVPDVSVTMTGPDNLTSEFFTDEDGNIGFLFLPVGRYLMSVENGPDIVLLVFNCENVLGRVCIEQIPECVDDSTCDFSVFASIDDSSCNLNCLGTIEGRVFADNNGNGVWESSEEGIAGIEIILTSSSANLTTITDEKGDYSFENLIEGTHEITLGNIPAGNPITASGILTTPSTFTIELDEGDEFFKVDYGFGLPAGCLDPIACNYDPLAEVDDGFCYYGNAVCSDPCNIFNLCLETSAFPDTICAGTTTTLSVDNGDIDDSLFSYEWLIGDNVLIGQSIDVNPSVTTTYTLRVRHVISQQIIGFSEVEVYVHPLVFNIFASNTNLCIGESTEIEVFPLLGTPIKYEWSTGETTKKITVENLTETTEYTVTVTGENDCKVTKSYKIFVSSHGFISQPTNELIVKYSKGEELAQFLGEWQGVLIDSCLGIALVKLDSIEEGKTKLYIDIKGRTAAEEGRLNPEGVGINYRNIHCERIVAIEPESDHCSFVNAENSIMNDIIIGLIDTGIEFDYEFQYTFDTTGIGLSHGYFVEDGLVKGIDQGCDLSSLQDEIGHGTHIANIITSNKGDGTRIFIAQVFEKACQKADLFSVICAIKQMTKYNNSVSEAEKIRVLNISMGYYGVYNSIFEEAIDEIGKTGTTVVCSAGNEKSNLDEDSDWFLDTLRTRSGEIIEIVSTRIGHFPSEFDSKNLICVAAWDNLIGSLAEFSNHGKKSVDVVAPGNKIKSKIPKSVAEIYGLDEGAFAVLSGTSMAAAFITRWVANLLVKDPCLTTTELLEIMKNQSASRPGLNTKTKNNGLLPFKMDITSCSSIEGYVWTDENEDSNFDPTEKGIAGIQILAALSNGDTIIRYTDSKGYYGFFNVLEYGDCTIKVGRGPQNSYLTTIDAYSFSLPIEDGVYNNFGFTREICENYELLGKYPWLENIVDFSNCTGVFIKIYEYGEQQFLEIINNGTHKLYLDNGLMYCENDEDIPCDGDEYLSCVENFCFNIPYTIWDCCGNFNEEDNDGTELNNCNAINKYPWIADQIDIENCTSGFIKVYNYDDYDFILISDGNSNKLYSDIAGKDSLWCTDMEGFNCESVYGLSSNKIIMECNCGDEILPTKTSLFEEYPWILEWVDPDNCTNEHITEYAYSDRIYLFIETDECNALYKEDGSIYCIDYEGFSCVDHYGVLNPVDTWSCIDGRYDPESGNEGYDPESGNEGYDPESGNEGYDPEFIYEISPNPNNGRFNVLIPEDREGVHYVNIFDTKGQLIQSKNTNGVDQAQVIPFDMNNAPRGIYFIEVINNYKKIVKRFVKY